MFGNSRCVVSLGVLLYFLVTGSYPLDGGTGTEIRRQHDQGTSRRPLRDVRPDLPDAFIRTVERALSEDPRQRFGSADALESALASTIADPVEDRSWWRLAAIAAAVVIVAGLTALGASRGWIFGRTQTGDSGSAASAVSSSPVSTGAAATDYRIDRRVRSRAGSAPSRAYAPVSR